MSTESVSLYSALAIKKALDDVIADAYTRETGYPIDGVYDPTTVLLRRIEEGARPDVLVAVSSALDTPEVAAIIDGATRRVLAKVGVGIAAAPSIEVPDVSTVDALVKTLLAARSVAYSRTGASGIYFARLLTDLGIADKVNTSATIVDKGFTALAVLDGRADLAIQQVSELLFVPEATIVGPLPEAVQHYTEFSVALGRAAFDKPAATALLGYLTSTLARDAYVDAGLEIP